MKHLLFLLLLLPLVARGMDYTPIQERVSANVGEYWVRHDGDSWTSNYQVDSETGAWESNYYNSEGGEYELEGGTPYSLWKSKNFIWDDPSLTHSTEWAAQLAYRLGNTHWYVEAIGGANIGENNGKGNALSTEYHDQIIEWTKDTRGDAKRIDLMVLYGGINDLHGSLTSLVDSLRYDFPEMKRRMSTWAATAAESYPKSQVLMLTHQPCGFNYMSLKNSVYGAGAGYDLWTWDRVFSEAMLADSLQDSLEVYLMGTDEDNYGSLRRDVFSLGVDSSRVFAYNLRDALRVSSDSMFTSQYQWCIDSLTVNSVDTTGVHRLDIVAPVADADKLHMNALGVRRIGDLIFNGVFGGEDLPNAERNRTIYVDVDKGDNWDNRGYETEETRPLRTVQAAIYRAFPGDSIVVTGSPQNLSSLTRDGHYSLFKYDLLPIRSGLTFNFADGLYYRGYPAENGDSTYNTPHFPDDVVVGATAITLFDENRFMSGDTTWDFNTVDPTTLGGVSMILGYGSGGGAYDTLAALWLKDMDYTFYGLNLQGYTNPLDLENVSGMTFKNGVFCGADGTASASYALTARGRPMEFTWEDCTFYNDSVSTSSGLMSLENFGAETGANNRFYSDSMTTSVTFKNCDFIGDEDVLTGGIVSGFIDGLTMIGCTITDLGCTRYPFSGYSYYELKADSSDIAPAPLVMVNNTFNLQSHLDNTGDEFYLFKNWMDEDPGDADECIDSLIFVNNLISMIGPEAATQKTRIFYDQYIDSAACDIRSNTVYTEDSGGDDGTQAGTVRLRIAGGTSLGTVYFGSTINTLSFAADNYRGHSGTVFSAENDTLIYGGAQTWDGGDLDADYGVAHGALHASRGAVQYTDAPSIILGSSYTGSNAYGQRNIYGAASLIASGLYPACDSLDTSTWIRVQTPTSAAEQSQADLILQMYNDMPAATKRDMKLTFLN